MLTIRATVAGGYDELAFQWLHDARPVVAGPGGASTGGGYVAGATGRTSGGIDLVLTIARPAITDAGRYTVLVQNDCAVALGRETEVLPGCQPDFNRDGTLDEDDVAAIINTVGGGGCP